MARVSAEDVRKYQGLWFVKASELETIEQNLALELRVGRHPWSAHAPQKSLRLLILAAQFCGAVADGFADVALQGRRLDGEVAETAIAFDRAAVHYADEVTPAIRTGREIPLPFAPLRIPEPLPRVNMTLNQDLALFAALEAAQTKLFWASQGLGPAELIPRHLERRYAEFTARMDALSSEIQTIRQLLVGDRPSDRIRLDCRQRSLAAIGECFVLMQTVAVPDWLSAPTNVVPVPEEYLWSLTLDPAARNRHANPGGHRELRQLWDHRLHTSPEKTYQTALAIRDSLNRRAISLKPDTASPDCPWGSRYVAEQPLTIAGVDIPAGTVFRYVVEISPDEGVSRKVFLLGSDEARRTHDRPPSVRAGPRRLPPAPAGTGGPAPTPASPSRLPPRPTGHAAPPRASPPMVIAGKPYVRTRPKRSKPAQHPASPQPPAPQAANLPPDPWFLTHPLKRREFERDMTGRLRAERELREFWRRLGDWRSVEGDLAVLNHACHAGFLRRAREFNPRCPWDGFFYVRRPCELAGRRFQVGARITMRLVDRGPGEPWVIQLGSATRSQLLGI
ncbi:MAG: hypothetical protein ACXV5Q_07145 [Frankiaceae bacterium]